MFPMKYTEVSTSPEVFDSLVPDDDGLDYRDDRPRITHGPNPRLPKRPSFEVWRRDPHNLYRPVRVESDPDLEVDRGREREVARLLRKTARYHASMLSWRSDDAIAEFIESEALP